MPSYWWFTHNLLGSSKGLGHFSGPAHTGCLLGSSPYLSLLLVVVPRLRHLQNAGLVCFNWAALSPIASPTLSPGTSALPHSAKPVPYDLPMPSKLVPPGWLLHIMKFSCQHEAPRWPPLEHSFSVLKKQFPEDFASVMLVSAWFQMTSIYCPRKALGAQVSVILQPNSP